MAELRLRELGNSDQARWDRFAEARPEATFFHLAGWREVIEESLGHRAFYVFAERGDEITGILPLIHVRSRLFGNRLTSTAFCDRGGPATVDEESRDLLLNEAVRLAADLDVDYLECRCAPPAKSPDLLSRSDLYASFRKMLHPDPQENLKALHRKRRAMIRKGIGAGLKSVVESSIDRHYKIFAVSVRNLGTPVLPRTYFKKLSQVFGKNCQITSIIHEQRAVASVMSFFFRDEVLAYHGGGLAEARDLAANDFMYWEVMRRACEQGIKWFDFGRSKIGTGAYEFKRNWGFEPDPLTYCYQLRRLKALPEVNPLNPKYQLLIALWKRMPLPISMALGPRIVRALG